MGQTVCLCISGWRLLRRKIKTLPSTGLSGRASIIHIAVNDLYDLGQEFFRWEFATAVAGTILDLNPFDQPDVGAKKSPPTVDGSV